ncbi:MAG: 50S ribosomal protein L6 [Myxococcota bacterium]
MSRVGKQPIDIPDGVTVDVQGDEVLAKGPKGTLRCSVPAGITVKIDGGRLIYERPDDTKESRARHGLARALGNNLVVGVSTGFAKRLEIEGVGYRAGVKGKTLNLLLGFSHPVNMEIPDGLNVKVEANTTLNIEGPDKQLVGQFAANIRSLRPPEPYKGKGIRYHDEHIRRKVGKAGA